MTFPQNFIWGVATAAYQVEGAATQDGRGPSIWDTFSRMPGKTLNGDTGDVACDQYNRLDQDLDLIASIVGPGGAYRFSISWPRVMPDGVSINQAGLDYYNRVVDGLLARELQPFPTLFHWDLPQAVQDRGGWPARDTANMFADYADHVVRELGDRVGHWFTINEPYCSAWLGHLEGVFAPGVQDLRQAVYASHHLLMAHGHSVRAVREHGRANAVVGPVFNLSPCDPASDDPRDVAAARRADGHTNRWWADPVFGRGYPQDMVDVYEVTPPVLDDDLELISAPIDFFGLNYYFRFVVGDPSTAPQVASASSGASGAPPAAVAPYIRTVMPEGAWTTAMGWEVNPEGMVRMLRRLRDEYGVRRLLVTENGSAWEGDAVVDGQVHDPDRTRYLQMHLDAISEAIDAGLQIDGYFAWSLMDNFEWAQGYSKRFGIVHVDYETQKRTIKDSGKRYQSLIAEHRSTKR